MDEKTSDEQMDKKISEQIDKKISSESNLVFGIVIMIVGIVIGYFFAVAITTDVLKLPFLSTELYGDKKGGVGISTEDISLKVGKYLTNNFLKSYGAEADIVNLTDLGDLYLATLDVKKDNETLDSGEVYVTKDGKFVLFGALYNMSEEIKFEEPEVEPEAELTIPKTEKPVVELFVMAYCPYGLQAEKAIIPVYDLLSEKTDIKIRFVDYIMHGKKEIDENLRQYCIQRDQEDKYFQYLLCFVQTDNYSNCLTETGIDLDSLDNCTKEVDKEYNITDGYNNQSTWLNGRYPLFNVEKDLNNKYNVGGSPTFVVNGVVVSPSSRSPEAYKNVICSAFSEAPSECNSVLSSSSTAPGIGSITATGSGSSGTC